MSSWLVLAGALAAILGALGAVAFVVTSLAEREWRAALVSLALSVAVLAPLLVPLLIPVPGREIWLATVLGVGVAALAMLALPLGGGSPVGVLETPERVDERDAVFHRFYTLQPGTEELDAYYRQHPEKRALDERIRARPQIGEPGTPAYRPETAPFAGATFEVIDRLNHSLDEAAVGPVGREGPDRPSAGSPVPMSRDELTMRVKGFARHHGACMVGCARLDPALVYSHNARGEGGWGEPIHLDHTHAVVVAVEMDARLVAAAPEMPTLTESAARYLEGAKIALLVAAYLRRLGHRARAHVDGNYRVLCVPLAVEAGLGELGRMGLLMTPRYGPRVRLAVVTTDAALSPDRPVATGAAAFCRICRKCSEACPSGAIDAGDPEPRNGVRRWQTRHDACYRYWRQQGTDCALCIRVCPFSHPGTAVHGLVRLAIRRSRLVRRLALWGDDLCYGRRPPPREPPAWHLL